MTREEQMKLAIRILDSVVSYRSPRLKDIKTLRSIVPEHIRHWGADDLAVHLVKSLTISARKCKGFSRNRRDNSASAGATHSVLRACTKPKGPVARSDLQEPTFST
jgi:hypothetical protein